MFTNETTLDTARLKTSLEVSTVKLCFKLCEGEFSPCCAHFQHRSCYTNSHICTEIYLKHTLMKIWKSNFNLSRQLRGTPITSTFLCSYIRQKFQTNQVGNIKLVDINKNSLAFGVKEKWKQKRQKYWIPCFKNIISSPKLQAKVSPNLQFHLYCYCKMEKVVARPKAAKTHSFLSRFKLPHTQHPTKNRMALSSCWEIKGLLEWRREGTKPGIQLQEHSILVLPFFKARQTKRCES